MKFSLVFLCACVVITHQQFQRTRAMLWLSPYYSSPQSAVNNYQGYRYNDVPYLNDEFNREKMESHDNLDGIQYQSKIRGSLAQEQVNPRFFFGLNPFAGSGSSAAVPTIISMATTVASIVTCIPAFQFSIATPLPCVGRKRREIDDVASEHIQFPIAPTATLKLTPTHLVRENRQLTTDQSIGDILHPSKDDVTHDEVSYGDQTNMRDRRFFLNNGILSNGLFGGSSAMGATPVVSYSFVPTTLTQTVNLLVPAPTTACMTPACAACLPAGFVVCRA
ncbi:uncharacterized protein LOC130690005 [Daphnia carinata]|uniref:uncharacterized protein LOC130690005 n=1 Tax=Daphnia carinata TaxID=120202 RepID=UPI00257DD016|nr:uncharacterized protein LOC130690005 [Daphnia carinata]